MATSETGDWQAVRDAGGEPVRLVSMGLRAADNTLLLEVSDGETQTLLAVPVQSVTVVATRGDGR